ncbi:hypothetical protein DICSQDRAFT_172563 [Dichomitus squalens LYAD-421 SS1]|uniref:Uncharacterized protein n=1 Tax=Dichomitus squalens (strain LYAD-421) TaxID=732165 RepID=R7SRT4_DICSQ|nr:uncharacterized protein DICSQDRAFT_172563 [Dichomitus squalens LYAD-421 SS1]EJF58904.1 hypothetical protein DICSQDRAFT_172563 [Dichomitus squalens LYAD-421 SS1]
MSELAREDEAGQAAYREITTSICEDERMVPEFVEELIAHPVSYPSAISPDPEPSPSLAVQKPETLPPIDPAYRVLLPILHELDEMTINPRCRTIAEEHQDEDYSQFWEIFSQVSAKEILDAVYAIRAGVLDIPADPCSRDDSFLLTTLFVLWAGSATLLSMYLYFCHLW